MKNFRFNTNFENTEDMQQLSGTLNKDRRIISFKVDMKDSMHTLEVSCNEDITEQEVRNLIREAGYQTSDGNKETFSNTKQL